MVSKTTLDTTDSLCMDQKKKKKNDVFFLCIPLKKVIYISLEWRVSVNDNILYFFLMNYTL